MAELLSTPHNSPSWVIRQAKRDDVVALVNLINALNVHEGTSQTMTWQHAEYILFSDQRQVELYCKVALINNAVIGFVLFYRGYDTASTSFGLHISDIYVEQSARKHGIGKALMAEVANTCLSMGGQWCSLTTAQNNHAARVFYDACGCAVQPVEFRAMGAKGMKSIMG